MVSQPRRMPAAKKPPNHTIIFVAALLCLLCAAFYLRRDSNSGTSDLDSSDGLSAALSGTSSSGSPSTALEVESSLGSRSDASLPNGSTLSLYKEGENLVQQVDLKQCLAEPPGTNSTWMTAEMYLSNEPTRLVLDLSLLSPYKSSIDVTLVVTYDVSRLYMLDGLCLSWGGPISASVYQVRSYLGGTTQVLHDDPPSLTKEEPIRDARYRVTDIFERVTQQRTCALDILLFTEQVPRADPFMPSLFPVNALRNRALLVVRTALVLVIDGDLLVQSEVGQNLQRGSPTWASILREARAGAYRVLPSFDTRETTTAYRIASGGKKEAVAAYRDKSIVRFGAKNSRFPQGCTDYERWPTANEQYEVVYCNRYEPWGMVSRLLTPWFDSRFRGYGRNKIMYAAALNSSGFNFVIDPQGFVIHRPHTKSTAQRIFDDENDRRIHNHIMDMFNTQKAEGFFDPVVDATTAACRDQLPWWRSSDLEAAEVAAPSLRRAEQRRDKVAATAEVNAAVK